MSDSALGETPDEKPASACGWPKTRWTELRKLGAEGSTEAIAALGRLCESYRPALLGFARRWGLNEDRAEEAVQAFMVDLIRRGSLLKLSPEKGRFRSFLRVCLRNFLNNWIIKNPVPEPGPGEANQSSPDAPPKWPELVDDRTADRVLDEIWAWRLVDLTMERLEAEFRDWGKAEQFAQLRAWLPGGQPSISRAEVAERLGMKPNAVEQAVHRLRLRFGSVLRDLVAETVDSPSMVEEELRYLLGILAG